MTNLKFPTSMSIFFEVGACIVKLHIFEPILLSTQMKKQWKIQYC